MRFTRRAEGAGHGDPAAQKLCLSEGYQIVDSGRDSGTMVKDLTAGR